MSAGRLRKAPAACVAAFLLALMLLPAAAASTAATFGWARSARGGFGAAGNTTVSSLACSGSRIYAGTYNAEGCQVWSTDGIAWRQEVGQGAAGTPTGPGFGEAGNNNVSCMAAYGPRLYAGTRNPARGCQVWSTDGIAWRQEVGQGEAGAPTGPGFGEAGNNEAMSMVAAGGLLYVGTYNARGCQVWSYDGDAWRRVAHGGFADADNCGAAAMAAYFDSLYVGTFNVDYASGCQVWAWDGIAWRQEVGQGAAGTPTGPGFGDDNNRRAASMAVYDSLLYVGTYDSSGGSGCQVWAFDGANWTRSADGGFADPRNLAASGMVASALYLFAGTYNEERGCELWRFDGVDWRRESCGGFGDVGNVAATALLLSGPELYAGTQCERGSQVWSAQAFTPLYFAEGYTGGGFREYLCLGNPGSRDAEVALTYLFPDSATLAKRVVVPAESRLTIFVNADVGEGREVSAVLECDPAIVAERPVYFTYNGVWAGGHNAVAAPSPARAWYFAEGYTGAGFEQWVCVLNPGHEPAELTFRFHTQEKGEQTRGGFAVPARSRRSFRVNDILGPDLQNSLKLEASAAVVAERPMYFDYLGPHGHHWQGGHCVMGETALSQVFFFAEGTTRPGFEEWLTLQNPNPHTISVSASYQVGPGQGDAVQRSYAVRAGGRQTVFVPAEAGAGKDVSVVLASTHFFLAERPMYYLYGGFGAQWAGGDCVVGAKRAAAEWFLAEGYSGEGYHTWLCLQNPGMEDAAVSITYYSQEEGMLPPRLLDLAAGSRHTLFVNDHAGAGYQLSARVLSDRPVVVERPMYFDADGVQGGHGAVGHAVR